MITNIIEKSKNHDIVGALGYMFVRVTNNRGRECMHLHALSVTFPSVPYPASAGLDWQSKIREFPVHRTPRASRTDLTSASAKVWSASDVVYSNLCRTIRAFSGPSALSFFSWEFPIFFCAVFSFFSSNPFWVSWRPHRLIVAVLVCPVRGVRRALPDSHPATTAQGAAQPAHHFWRRHKSRRPHRLGSSIVFSSVYFAAVFTPYICCINRAVGFRHCSDAIQFRRCCRHIVFLTRLSVVSQYFC